MFFFFGGMVRIPRIHDGHNHLFIWDRGRKLRCKLPKTMVWEDMGLSSKPCIVGNDWVGTILFALSSLFLSMEHGIPIGPALRQSFAAFFCCKRVFVDYMMWAMNVA